jgi:Uma2 family endonuclease
MSALETPRFVTLVEYLAGERDVDVRHEWVLGQVYAMAGGSMNHSLVCTGLGGALFAASRAKGCRLHSGSMKVRIADSYVYYPDVMVACEPIGTDRYVEQSPCIVAEVLSPSTRKVDDREKRAHYSQLPSLTAYLLVEADQPAVELYRRDPDSERWISERFGAGESFHLECLDLWVEVDAIYEGLDL